MSFISNSCVWFFTKIAENIPTSIFGLLIGYIWGRRKIKVELEAKPIRTDEQKKRNAQKGLILIVPLSGLTTEDIKQAIQSGDYKKLNIENTSLGHNIKAVETHLPGLEHCWMIGSYGSRKGKIPWSIDYEELLKEYLYSEKKATCEFHYGKEYAVSLDDDSEVCKEAYQITNGIFQEARKEYGLKPKSIITDVTGGTRSINLGVIMACLHKDHDVQIIGAPYNEDGSVIRESGKTYPIRMHFVPETKR